ncbi:MAG: lipase secretion chaperone, partial [Acidobacteriota bacterium]
MNAEKTVFLLVLTLFATPLVASDGTALEGTVPDGRFAVEADGRLVVDGELLLAFDYFLSARGEIADAELVRLVATEASRQLVDSPKAAARAGRLFARYLRALDLVEAEIGSEIEAGVYEPSRAVETYQRLDALRVDAFGEATARALFGDALRHDRAAVKLLAARLDADTDADRLTAHRAWEASLPAAERAARAAARLPLDVAAQVDALRAEGASADEIWALRADAFGADAADRLA